MLTRLIPTGTLRRLRFLATTSCLPLALLAAGASFAADAEKPAASPSVFDGTTVSVEGGYLLNDSEPVFGVASDQDKLGDLSGLKPGRDGTTFGLTVTHALDSSWDWRFAVKANSLNTTTTSGTGNSTDTYASSHFDFQYSDFEVGHRTVFDDADILRVFAGPRVLHADSSVDYGYDGTGKLGAYNHDSSDAYFWAAGPRIGIEGSVPLWASGFSLNGSVAGSALFSDGHQDFRRVTDTGTTESRIGLGDSTIWNAETWASLAYNFKSNVRLDIGYQYQRFWNLAPSVMDGADDGTFKAGRADVTTHGPFARFTVEIP